MFRLRSAIPALAASVLVIACASSAAPPSLRTALARPLATPLATSTDAATAVSSTPATAPATGPISTPATGPASLPSPAPTVGPTTVPAPTPTTGLSQTGPEWQVALDGFSATGIGLSQPIRWHGGFAVLEQVAETTTALWTSADGRHWASQPLPFRPVGTVRDLLPYRDGLALAQFVSSGRDNRFDIWTSADGKVWQNAGGATLDHEANDLHFSASVVSVGDGLAVIATIVRGICCGVVSPPGSLAAGVLIGGAGQSSAGEPSADPAVGVFAWTSPNGVRWTKHRLQGFGTDSLSVIGTLQGDLLAVRHQPVLRLVRSPDAVHWTSVAALPGVVDPDSSLEIGSVQGRLIIAADTAVHGTNVTIWSGAPHDSWSQVLLRQGWEVHSIAVDGGTAILGGDFAGPFALVSRDGGSTWEEGGAFRGVGSNCDAWVALAGETAIAVLNCGGGQTPRVLVADLPNR